MKQLGILDSAFINLEHPNTPQHVGGLGIYDQSTAPGGKVRFKEVIASFERKLKKLPLFRTRLVQVPGGYDRPYWVQDNNFDMEFHLRHIALPKPGDWRQLCILIARLHARPLDMSRPLWEAYIIEGLDNVAHLHKNNCFAVYTKMHHSMVDGAGGASFMSALHDLEPNPSTADEEGDNEIYLAEHQPSAFNMLTRGTFNTMRNGVNLMQGLYKNSFAAGRNILDIARGRVPMPDIRAPKTRFNQAVGPYRIFEAALFNMDDLKAVKNATGTKVNDVAITIIAGAMRHYLQHHNELPSESLSATMPLNMRTRRDETEENNQVGSVFTNIHTDIEDPVERLYAIHKSTIDAKAFGEQTPLVDTLKLAGVFSPRLTRSLVRLYVDNSLTERLPFSVSTAISNVAGPPFPLYCSGAKMLQYHGVGLLTAGVGLFHLVFSYFGTVTITVVGDRASMPDPSFYRECLEKSFAELKAAALKKGKTIKHKAKIDAEEKQKVQEAGITD